MLSIVKELGQSLTCSCIRDGDDGRYFGEKGGNEGVLRGAEVGSLSAPQEQRSVKSRQSANLSNLVGEDEVPLIGRRERAEYVLSISPRGGGGGET